MRDFFKEGIWIAVILWILAGLVGCESTKPVAQAPQGSPAPIVEKDGRADLPQPETQPQTVYAPNPLPPPEPSPPTPQEPTVFVSPPSSEVAEVNTPPSPEAFAVNVPLRDGTMPKKHKRLIPPRELGNKEAATWCEEQNSK